MRLCALAPRKKPITYFPRYTFLFSSTRNRVAVLPRLSFDNEVIMKDIAVDNIESQREENIKRNRERLRQLGISLTPSASSRDAVKRPPPKKRKLDHVLPPSRSSARIASTPARPSYFSQGDDGKDVTSKARKRGPHEAPKKTRVPVVKEDTAPMPVKDIESIRAGWTSWVPTASPPARDEDYTFQFRDQPSFRPNKSPEEMIREGCFGGSYFRPLYSRRLGTTVFDDHKELPSSWYSGLDVSKYLTSPKYDVEINKYRVSSGQSIEEWEAAGWINHKYDIRGWFQWYCRFYMGRRCEDDERQISRWRKCVGDSGRWRRMLLKKYVNMGIREVFDDGEDEEGRDVSPVMHQTCHHWGYEIRQGDLERFWN